MNKILIIFSLVLLAACGPSQKDKNIAAVTCSIMSETRNMDAAVRVEKMNDAREKIGGEPFLRGDDTIKAAFELGLCQELVLGTYDEIFQSLMEGRRIAAEKQRIADSKPTVKEEFYSSGKLKSRIHFQPKSDGGKEHGLSEDYYENGQLRYKRNVRNGKVDGPSEYYHENGQLESKVHWKDGIRDGLRESYHENGQLEEKGNYKDRKRDGLWESYHENGELKSKVCYKNGEKTDMSYCEK